MGEIAHAIIIDHCSKMSTRSIRSALPGDAAGIQSIYGHHVEHGTATFDTVAPSAGDWETRIADIRERDWPFVVAIIDDHIVGYAYAVQFRDRPAYTATCENSIYVAPDWMGQDVGFALAEALMQKAAKRGFDQMIAVIGGAERASVALHRKCGFVEVGRLHNVGRKFGRLLDTLYMQRDLRNFR